MGIKLFGLTLYGEYIVLKLSVLFGYSIIDLLISNVVPPIALILFKFNLVFKLVVNHADQ